MADAFEYTESLGKRYKRPVRPAGHSRTADEGWKEIDANAGTAKSDAAVKADLGFKSSGDSDSKYEKMSDAEIDALPPLLKASARARKRRASQGAVAQAEAIKR